MPDKDCPICERGCFSNNIQDGCYSYYCEDCAIGFKGEVVDIRDFTISELRK